MQVLILESQSESLVALKRQKKWAELLEACLPQAASGRGDILELLACSLFHCGRFEECLSVLDKTDDFSWQKKLQRAAVHLDMARTTGAMKNAAVLRGACSALRKLVLEASSDHQRRLAVFNLALALLVLNDHLEATRVLEGEAKALALQERLQKRSKFEGVALSSSLELARDIHSCKGVSDEFRSLLAVCYVISGQFDAANVLFQSSSSVVPGMAEFRVLASAAERTLQDAPPAMMARQRFAGGDFQGCLNFLDGLDSVDALEIGGCAHLELGNFEHAITALKKCCSLMTVLNEQRPNVLYNLFVAVCGAGRDASEQVALISSLVRVLQASQYGGSELLAETKIRQAALLTKLSRFEEAVLVLNDVRLSYPNAAARVLQFHVDVLMKTAKYSDALELLKSVDPKNGTLFAQRLECLVRLGRVEELLYGLEVFIENSTDTFMLCNAAIAFLAHFQHSK